MSYGHSIMRRQFSTQTQCTNCGNYGHILRNCTEPITSYGIIAIRSSTTETADHKFCSPRTLLTGMEHHADFQFLLIQRRDSLSFIEFIRGKYSLTNQDYLKRLFRSMTRSEHSRILTLTFDQLWQSVWGATSLTHRTDYDYSEARYNELCGPDRSGLILFIVENNAEWDEPEWGFPKGRRDPYESDIHCAIREFKEETNIKRDAYHIISNIQPLTETFFGSNHVHYCHKYYIAICSSTFDVALAADNPLMLREIGDIKWLTLEEALQKIRPDSVEKREILLKAGRILRNFCPVPQYNLRRGLE